MTVGLRRAARLGLALVALLIVATGARAQNASPYAIDIPSWFTETFLDFRDDVADAAKDGRRLMLYFGQDGCPYCRQLMVTNFSQRAIVDKTRRRFVAIALNIWGDRETTWIDGRTMSEKALARALDVQFTPTLLFLDEKGAVVARLNGYWPPHRFEPVLDYVSEHREKHETLAAYLAQNTPQPGSATLADEPWFVAPPYDLARKPGGRPLAVLFETTDCGACDELHRDLLRRSDVRPRSRASTSRASPSAHPPISPGRAAAGCAPTRGRASSASPTRRPSCSSTPAAARSSGSTRTCAASTSRRRWTTSRAAPSAANRRSSATCRRAPIGCAPAAPPSTSGNSDVGQSRVSGSARACGAHRRR